MNGFDAAASFDAPEQLIGPKREIASLSFARLEGLVRFFRAPVNSSVRFLLNGETQRRESIVSKLERRTNS